MFAIEKIVVKGLFRDKAIVEIDGKQRLLSIGKASPEGVTLISANSAEAVLEIDGEQKTYALGAHIGASFKGPAPGKTVTVAPDEQGTYSVNGSINGFQVDFIVDTGASLVAMNRNVARRLGLQYRLEGRESVSETASGTAKVYLLELDRVSVGDIELRDVLGAVHDGDFPRVILLGNSFLSRVKMERDGQLLRLIK